MTARDNLYRGAVLVKVQSGFQRFFAKSCKINQIFFSAQHSVYGFVTSLQNGIFSFPQIVEIFINVEHYLENND